MNINRLNDLLLKREDASKWISISNVLVVLLIIFILIAILVMNANSAVNQEVEEAISDYREDHNTIYEALNDEFKDDLKNWNATIDKDSLAIIFHSYEFTSGSTELNNELKKVLDSFFPRYIKTCYDLADKIDEVRIEGHTDSAGLANKDINGNYLFNLGLSQSRTLSLLKYGFDIMSNNSEEKLLEWMRKKITATGFSFSRPVLTADGKEDKQASRRVEFRVLPKASSQLEKINTIMSE